MLYADMALYDMLHLFETGRSHMALLARPRSGHGLTAAEAAEAFSEAPLPVNGKQEHQHEAQENGNSEHLNGMAEVLHAEVHLGPKVMPACCPSLLSTATLHGSQTLQKGRRCCSCSSALSVLKLYEQCWTICTHRHVIGCAQLFRQYTSQNKRGGQPDKLAYQTFIMCSEHGVQRASFALQQSLPYDF